MLPFILSSFIESLIDYRRKILGQKEGFYSKVLPSFFLSSFPYLQGSGVVVTAAPTSGALSGVLLEFEFVQFIQLNSSSISFFFFPFSSLPSAQLALIGQSSSCSLEDYCVEFSS